MNQKDFHYPIGEFFYDANSISEKRVSFIKEIEETPAKVEQALKGLSENQLNIPYRPGGWTIRQVVHHIPESHMNAYIRFKLALTEDVPIVKTYEESKWAELKDIITSPVEVSLNLLYALHKRWIILLNSLDEDDFKKEYSHPVLGTVDLNWAVAQYAWHGKHHTAHITSLRERMNW